VKIALDDRFAISTAKHRNPISGRDYLIITGNTSRRASRDIPRAGKTITIYIRASLTGCERRKRIIPFESNFDENEPLSEPGHTEIFTLSGGLVRVD